MDLTRGINRRAAGKLFIAISAAVASTACAGGAESKGSPVVRNADVTLSYDKGWLVQAVKPKPQMTLKAGDRLLDVGGNPAASLGPLRMMWVLNQAFDHPMEADVLRSGHRVHASIFRGDSPSSGRPVRVQVAASRNPIDFILSDATDHRSVSLHSLRGRWVLLNFWGTYCAPCRIEAPILTRLAHAEARRLTVLGLDVNDTHEQLTRFLAKNPRSYPILEAGNLSERLAVSYGVGNPGGGGSVPVSILIAPNGQIAYAQGGFWEPSPLEAEVHSYLDGHRPT